MTHLHSAWIEISGKVFVTDDELMLKLQELYPDVVVYDDQDDHEALDNFTAEQISTAFQDAAQDKISEAYCRTDEPVKVNEAIIDMKTYVS